MDIGNKQESKEPVNLESKTFDSGTNSMSETDALEIQIFKLMTKKTAQSQNLDPESTRADLSSRVEKVGHIRDELKSDAAKSPRTQLIVTAADQWMKAMINAGADNKPY